MAWAPEVGGSDTALPIGTVCLDMAGPTLDEHQADEILSVCRTVVGDELRSITYFNEATADQLYLRSDLDRTADLTGFADLERAGFRSQIAYDNSQLGEYLGTVRMFENGFLTRVIDGQHGVWVTTDGMSIDRFEEVVAALRPVLSEFENITE